jgi:hypothetical protein
MAKLDFAKGVSAVLTGTTNWAQLTEQSGPNKFSEKYQVELTLDAASIKTLESMKVLSHLEIKRQDGSKKYEDHPTVRLKTNQPPQLFDTARMPFNGNIGNGSTMRVKAFIKSWEMAGKKGLTAYINKGIVLALNDIDVTDDDELWQDVELTAPVTTAQTTVPGTKPDVATAPEAFEEADDDLPF